jgi:predicted transcriptional regulator YdeE
MNNRSVVKRKTNNAFQLVEIDVIRAIGISITLTKSQRENFTIVSRLWKKLNAEIHKIRHRPSPKGNWQKFGITYKHNHEYYYIAAIPFTEEMLAPPNMIRKDIPRGKYACFTHIGKMSHLKSTIYAIYTRILPDKEFIPEPQEKAGLIHFERYDNRFHWNRADSVIEIYVPIETSAKG